MLTPEEQKEQAEQGNGGKKKKTNSYVRTMNDNLHYFGLDEDNWTEKAKSETKTEFRNYLNGDGLTIALKTWLKEERGKKLKREKQGRDKRRGRRRSAGGSKITREDGEVR